MSVYSESIFNLLERNTHIPLINKTAGPAVFSPAQDPIERNPLGRCHQSDFRLTHTDGFRQDGGKPYTDHRPRRPIMFEDLAVGHGAPQDYLLESQTEKAAKLDVHPDGIPRNAIPIDQGFTRRNLVNTYESQLKRAQEFRIGGHPDIASQIEILAGQDLHDKDVELYNSITSANRPQTQAMGLGHPQGKTSEEILAELQVQFGRFQMSMENHINDVYNAIQSHGHASSGQLSTLNDNIEKWYEAKSTVPIIVKEEIKPEIERQLAVIHEHVLRAHQAHDVENESNKLLLSINNLLHSGFQEVINQGNAQLNIIENWRDHQDNLLIELAQNSNEQIRLLIEDNRDNIDASNDRMQMFIENMSESQRNTLLGITNALDQSLQLQVARLNEANNDFRNQLLAIGESNDTIQTNLELISIRMDESSMKLIEASKTDNAVMIRLSDQLQKLNERLSRRSRRKRQIEGVPEAGDTQMQIEGSDVQMQIEGPPEMLLLEDKGVLVPQMAVLRLAVAQLSPEDQEKFARNLDANKLITNDNELASTLMMAAGELEDGVYGRRVPVQISNVALECFPESVNLITNSDTWDYKRSLIVLWLMANGKQTRMVDVMEKMRLCDDIDGDRDAILHKLNESLIQKPMKRRQTEPVESKYPEEELNIGDRVSGLRILNNRSFGQ